MAASMIRRAWAVLARPSNDGRANPEWYRWAVNQCGHALVGAALASVLPRSRRSWLWIGGAYAAAKEVPDTLRRGGDQWDGAIDAAFVTVGAKYRGPRYWPVLIIGAIGVGVMVKAR